MGHEIRTRLLDKVGVVNALKSQTKTHRIVLQRAKYILLVASNRLVKTDFIGSSSIAAYVDECGSQTTQRFKDIFLDGWIC